MFLTENQRFGVPSSHPPGVDGAVSEDGTSSTYYTLTISVFSPCTDAALQGLEVHTTPGNGDGAPLTPRFAGNTHKYGAIMIMIPQPLGEP